MPSGKTNDMINFTRQIGWRSLAPFKKVVRDRSLNGKARIKARKEANKSG